MTRLLTQLGGARFTIGVSLALIAMGGAERRVGIAALIANGTSHLAVQILKRVVARPRPCDPCGVPLALVALPDSLSFPSGHAAASAALAASLTFWHPLLGVVVLPLAAGVAATRVTLRVHFVTDVLAGSALGLAGAIAAQSLLY